STSSIPVILAASQFSNVKMVLFADQSQANTEFIRGDVSILVSGLSVGVDLYKNGVPVQAANSFVSGLSYLVTYGKPVTSLKELVGKSIYVPFEGSPIDQMIAFLTASNGLTWKEDISAVYSPFDSSIELLKQGKVEAVVLPEPMVTLVEGQPDVFISLDLAKEWDLVTGSQDGYPQVSSFVNPDWAANNETFLTDFNLALADAIQSVQQDPQAAIEMVKDQYKLSPEKLLKSVSRTRYLLLVGSEMQSSIESYYQTIGKPLDENFSDFYFGAAH
ncbi:ABC transporter substrate-binding protein, partial [bacterium]|nr:ABC transporter substrate-binding protein [bacterium]